MEKDFFFRTKVDKEQIEKDFQEDFSLLPQQKSFNKRCLRNFFLEQKKVDDLKVFIFQKKKLRTHLSEDKKMPKKRSGNKLTCFFQKKEKMFVPIYKQNTYF